MSFLSVLFLAGSAAIILPIAIHMIRRSPRKNLQFSSLMFLDPSPETVTSRRQIQHWLLLFLRVLAILLIALAFARPYLPGLISTNKSRQAKLIMIVVDSSASMQSEEIHQKRLARYWSISESLSEHDQLAVVYAEKQLRTIISFDEWASLSAVDRRGQVRSQLRMDTVSGGVSHLAGALIEAATLSNNYANELGINHVEVHLMTDMQKPVDFNRLQSNKWPEKVKFKLHNF